MAAPDDRVEGGMLGHRNRIFLALAATLALPAAARATTTIDYNIVVSGNFASNGSDTEGRIAAGGNITVGGYSIGANTPNGYVAVAGGSFNGSGGTAHGNVLASSYTGSFSYNGTAQTYSGGGTSPIAIASEMARLSALSKDLHNNAATYGTLGTTQLAYSQIYLVGSSNKVNVFNIDGSDLANNSGIHLAIPVGSLAVFNISGSTDGITNSGSDSQTYNGQAAGFTPASYSASNVLYNFYDATSLTPSGSVLASILAPLADIGANGGAINGQVFAKSYSGQTQINSVSFAGASLLSQSVAAVPEPGTWAMLMLGFGAIGFAARRRGRGTGLAFPV